MAKFTYIVKNAEGEKKKGIIEAADIKAATFILHERNLFVVDLKPVNERNLTILFSEARGVNRKDLAIFTRQLSTMISAGLNLLEALNVLSLQTPNQMLQRIIEEMVEDLQGGESLSKSLSRHPKVFGNVYISIVRAGEASGSLYKVLPRLAETLEKEYDFQRKIQGAMVYPFIVLVAMGLVLTVMMVFIVPKITSIFGDYGAQLPLATRIIINLSNFIINFWFIVVGLAIAGILAFQAYYRTPDGKMTIASGLLRVPVIGKLLADSTMSTFTRVFAVLVSSGVSILDALKISIEIADNYAFREALRQVQVSVEKGSSISAPIARQKIFPPIVGQMVSVGEETGKLDEVLSKLSLYFEEETESAVKNVTTAIEPLVVIILGLVAGFIVIAIILPIYNLTTIIGQ